MLAIFHRAVSHTDPDWDTALLASRISLAAGLIALIASIAALVGGGLSPQWRVGMVATLVAGMVVLGLAGLVEVLAHACFICLG